MLTEVVEKVPNSERRELKLHRFCPIFSGEVKNLSEHKMSPNQNLFVRIADKGFA